MKRILFFSMLLLCALTVQAQTQFNTPFATVAELSKNEGFRSRVGVAMYVRAGLALTDTTTKAAELAYYEKMFASLIVTEGNNAYFVSLFTNAALTQGANLSTPDVGLYAHISALWPEILKAWMYRNGYIKLEVPQE